MSDSVIKKTFKSLTHVWNGGNPTLATVSSSMKTLEGTQRLMHMWPTSVEWKKLLFGAENLSRNV